MSIEKARALAEERGLDLVEVAPNIRPPVCKIMDYGKYQYHQKKIETKHRKMQKKSEIKGIRLGFKIGDHDLETKIKQARGFLEDRNSVKVTLLFRGREAAYKELGAKKVMRVYEELQDICNMESPPKAQGNMLLMILTPKS